MSESLNDLIKICTWMNQAGFSAATSGNYSLRIDEDFCYVSASGIDKGNLSPADFNKISIDSPN